MSNHECAFDPAAVSLIADITEAAVQETKKFRIVLPPNGKEARQLLAKRIIAAIQAGKTDMPDLRDRALLPTLD